MSHLFDMASGLSLSDPVEDRTFIQGDEPSSYYPALQLRLLTVAEAEEQQRVPRPRPW